MGTEYETFDKWMGKLRLDIDSGNEVKIAVKDLDTFEKLVVRAKIAESTDALPGGVPLRIVNDMGEKKGAAYIEVLEELGEDELAISAD